MDLMAASSHAQRRIDSVPAHAGMERLSDKTDA
jgi:hypothetical protein